MTLPEQQHEAESNDAESLASLFEAFTKATMAQMHTWATSKEMPQSLHQFVDFTDIGYKVRYEVKHEYWDLFLNHHNDPF